jgi:hypothetical protein
MDGWNHICFVTLQSNGLLTYLRFGRIRIIDYNSPCINQQPTVRVIGLDRRVIGLDRRVIGLDR